ncbi:MAG: metal-sulfur cluster assembly factor [Sorangiineae bacterium]|nr:metal-sulfur cluster assembly factor [Polyangiaceae bacterium]MEB2323226.1 metal-sulfur cluster assembly factor [Sorangiineae bacterium]
MARWWAWLLTALRGAPPGGASAPVSPYPSRAEQEASAPMVGELYRALGEVIDPELGVDIVTLGLVYEVRHDDGHVQVVFTLTTRGCPLEHSIRGGIHAALEPLPGVRDVSAKLVWKPRWDPKRVEDGVF